MMTARPRAPFLAAALLAAVSFVSACRARPAPSAPTPTPALPPIPRVTGPLDVRVVYPPAGALVGTRDSNFIFGSVGNGDAALTVNGVPTRVRPNGAFLAWLPVPTEPRYELVATLGRDTLRREHPVRLLPPRRALSDTGRLVIDSGSIVPSWTAGAAGAGGATSLSLRDDELVRVAVRAPGNAGVWVEIDSATRRALVSGALRIGLVGAIAGSAPPRAAARGAGDPTQWATDIPAGQLREGATLVVARGADTLRFPLRPVAVPSPDAYAALGLGGPVASDTDRVVIARPVPDGTYKWFLLRGTVVPVTGRVGGAARVRLDGSLEAWVDAAEVDGGMLPAGYRAPRRVVGNLRVVPESGWVDVVIPVDERPPYLVEEDGDRLVLTLYGTRANTDLVRWVRNDSLVRQLGWAQETSDRARLTLRLAGAPYGYLVFWRDRALVLRVRRPPTVDPATPLRGLTIAVDAGHPPSGATGPTGLYEPVPTLAIAKRARALLEERGARVVMTRTTAAPVALGDRPVMARRANAHALVSVHLNALPDGIEPFAAQGTGTYFFHPHAEPLARAVQGGMVRRMGLPDLGVYYDNLALVRPTWMPAILCEGAFIIIPEQEAALRTPEFQEAYAHGIVDGLEAYFRGLGTGAPERAARGETER
jgi:N-acetylmuramoyl-L-alanine amidase